MYTCKFMGNSYSRFSGAYFTDLQIYFCQITCTVKNSILVIHKRSLTMQNILSQ